MPEGSQPLLSDQRDELAQYLESGFVRSPPRIFWKDHQHGFPALARLAKDILSIPATGAGVERLFNSAPDICHHSRVSLNPQTIQDLLMFMYISRVEVQEEQQAILKEYFSDHEIQLANEDKATPIDNVDPISEDEEECSNLLSGHAPEGSSQRALGKRRQSVASELEDDGFDIPLPNVPLRVSNKARKKSRLLEGYEVSPA